MVMVIDNRLCNVVIVIVIDDGNRNGGIFMSILDSRIEEQTQERETESKWYIQLFN